MSHGIDFPYYKTFGRASR